MTILSLPVRKRSELQTSLTALPEELQEWRNLAEPKGAFEKHRSQIGRLSFQVEGLLAPITAEAQKLETDDALFRSARKLELRILAVQSIWDYFRAKFLLRSGGPFAPFMRAADAFAWACYQPSLKAFAPENLALASPPLVALATIWSPNALPRDHEYEVVRTPGGWTDTAAFSKVIASLPVPILGIPWSHLDNLPQLALLAHEVGHVVEHDFCLEEPLEQCVRRAAIACEQRRGAWLAWRKELFADLYGCYAAGPQFPWALSEVLTANSETIMGESQSAVNWSAYPGATLRMEWNACVLRTLGWNDDAQQLLDQWMEVYPSHEFASFTPDLGALASELTTLLPRALDFRYVEPGRKSAVEQKNLAVRLAQAGFSFDTADLYEPRALVAAAGDLSRRGIGSRELWKKFRDRIVKARPPGELGPEEGAAQIDEAKERKTGEGLADEFFSSLFPDGPA